jgi:hypothetical protein
MAVCYVTYFFVLILDLSQPSQQQDMQVLLVLLFTCHQQQESLIINRVMIFITFIPLTCYRYF